MRISKILGITRIRFIIFLRLVKSAMLGTSSKISLEITSSYPVMFKKAILVIEFKTVGLLYLESKPGYKSIDLKRMYLDLNSIHDSEVVIIGYGHKKQVRAIVPIRNLVRTNLIKMPKELHKDFFMTGLQRREFDIITFTGSPKRDSVSTLLKEKKINSFPKVKGSNLTLKSWSNLS